MSTVPLSDVADRRHRPTGHQAADAGVVSRHASARPRQEGAVQHRVGPAPWDLDQCRLAGSAQTDAGEDRARPLLQAWRERAADRDRRRLYSAVSAAGRALGAVGAATPPLSWRSKRPRMGGLYTPGCKLSAGSKPPKSNGCAPASSPEPPSSATAGNGFSALRGSRVSPTSATSRAPVAPPPDTPPSAGQIPCSPTSKTASWQHTAPSRPNISLATSAPSPGASIAASF